MNKKSLTIILNLLFLIFLCFSIPFIKYLYTQHKNEDSTPYCFQNDNIECNIRMFERILPLLLIHTPIKNKKVLYFAKMDDNDPLWQPFLSYATANFYIDYVEVKSLESIEKYDFYSLYAEDKFKLRTFKFFVPSIERKEKFRKELFLTLEQLRKKKNKTILNIQTYNLEEDFISSILEYSDVLNEINIFTKFEKPKSLINAKSIFSKINKNFILVSRNSKRKEYSRYEIKSQYYTGEIYDAIFSLTYINKDIIDKHYISLEQNTKKIFLGEKILWHKIPDSHPQTSISYVIPCIEYIKQIILRNEKKE